MIKLHNLVLAQKFCSESLENVEGFEKAYGDKKKYYLCFHKAMMNPTTTRKKLIEENKYYKVPASNLIFITTEEFVGYTKNSQDEGFIMYRTAVKNVVKKYKKKGQDISKAEFDKRVKQSITKQMKNKLEN